MPKLTNFVLYLMSISAGLVVANLYYSQPLLNQIGSTFGVGKSASSNVVLAAQMGYAIGMLIILPLGDMISNIKILKVDFVIIILSLLAAATSNSLWMLIISCLFIGISSSIPQFFVPMAANLSDDKNRGRAIGIMMTGLLTGIIGSRVISGFVGGQFGWRSMYYISAGVMLVLFIIIYLKLPRINPHYKGTYKALITSLWTILKTQPELRLATVRGTLSFAGLTAMWTTLVFVMKDSFGYGSTITGLFGLFGIVGALGANVVGKFNDRYSKNKIIYVGIALSLFSWILFLFSTHFIVGIALGIITVDLGQQTIHITNQNIILERFPEARNRINMIYMVIFFIGGSLGASLGSIAYEKFGWQGVSIFGLGLIVLLTIIHELFRKKQVSENQSSKRKTSQ